MAWETLGEDTATSAVNELSVVPDDPKVFNQILSHIFDTGGTIRNVYRPDNDTGSNYAKRESANGAADTTSTSDTGMIVGASATAEMRFNVGFLISVTAEEKMMMLFETSENTAGAANAPDRVEHYSKWANTVDESADIRMSEDGTGQYNTDSNLGVLGDS